MTQAPVKAKVSLVMIVVFACVICVAIGAIGQAVTPVKPTSTPDPNEVDKYVYESITQDMVTGVLKAPSTAKFPTSDWRVTVANDIVTVSSYVDSQNSFGAMIRSNFTAQYRHSTKTLVYFEFAGQVVSGARQP